MPDSYTSSSVKCPYYIKDKPENIICEGFCDGTRINFWFQSKTEMRSYMEKNCFHIHPDCPIARMHEDLYSRNK
nr:MAG TPA: hypothetical protein [Caudoviricetes sp.]